MYLWAGLMSVLPMVQDASATPVKWTLDNVAFADNGSATGSFVFDVDTMAYSDVDIFTYNNDASLRVHYQDLFGVGTLTDTLIRLIEDPSVIIGSDALQLAFSAPLGGLGGTVAIDVSPPAPFSFERTCGDPSCSSGAATNSRRVATGSVIGVPVSIPEPSTLFLMVLAVAGARFSRTCFKAG